MNDEKDHHTRRLPVARAVLYGTFELEDVIAEHGGVPVNLARRAQPTFGLRLLHPRVRGGFHGYRQCDFEFLVRCGGNVAHLTHDWMREKTLFSFVPSTELPKAADSPVLRSEDDRPPCQIASLDEGAEADLPRLRYLPVGRRHRL